MKRLLILFLLFPLLSFSQNDWRDNWAHPDKGMHIAYSAMITSLAINMCQKDFKKPLKNPELIGVGIGITVGFLKEFVYDRNICKGKPDAFDLGADIVGVAISVPLTRLMNKWEDRHFSKKAKKTNK